MTKVLITYYSRTGNTAKIALAIADGVFAEGAEVQVKTADKVDVNDVLAADVVAVGSPISWGPSMVGLVKDLFERIYVQAKDKIVGKPYVSFVSCGRLENGQKALESIEQVADSLKMQKISEGIVFAGALGDKETETCRQLGKKLVLSVRK
jgi:NAD(P)H dehydrogenase (quinone)